MKAIAEMKCNTKFSLSLSWTYDLIAQLVRASERNSVVVVSDPRQEKFLDLLQRILHWWIPYVSVHSATFMWLPQKKTSIRIKVATDEGYSRNWMWHWTYDEIGVSVQI